MSPVSHQTIRLDRGRHTSAEQGACVMELASMLAGEPFSDHPECVCPVIGSFLRAYNDSLGDRRRQDLYPYAAMVVGTRAPAAVARARAERLRTWQAEMRSRRARSSLGRALARFMEGWWNPSPDLESVGSRAMGSIRRHTDETHAAALGLIEELVAIGREPVTSMLGPWICELQVPSPQI
jgi:hypothetical protein